MPTKNKPKKENNRVEEPFVAYRNAPVKIFNSFEEANEYDAKERAKLSPEESLMIATSLIKRIYADELAKVRKPYSKITIVKNEHSD